MPAFISYIPVLFLFVFLAIAGLIVWAVVQAQKSPTGQAEKVERSEMIHEVLAKRSKLVSWDNYSLLNLRPNAFYKYIKGLSKNTFSGRLMADDGEFVLAFHRIERGFQAVGAIAAATSAFEVFYIIQSDRTEFYYDQKKLGTVLKNGKIFNRDGHLIGNAFRDNRATISIGELVDIHTGNPGYEFRMNNRLLAYFHTTPRISNFFGSVFSVNENSGNTIVQLVADPNPEEQKWLEAWTIYELIYHGFWFSEMP